VVQVTLENEGNIVLQNVGNHTLDNAVGHTRRWECSHHYKVTTHLYSLRCMITGHTDHTDAKKGS